MYLSKTLFLILFIFSVPLFGQSKYTITGSVRDSDKNVLPFANLLLLKQSDSSFVKGVVSNENGNYKFDLINQGSYLILTSMIGYQSAYSEILRIDKDYELEISLLDHGETLKEVIVKADKPLYEQKIDRLVINVENSIVSAGGSALEILERSPGVIVNRQSSSITIVGKDGVQIMINGKMSYIPVASLIQVLDGMRADNIESIELITTPPANLDAEGNAGFINIITKKSSDLGLNGSYSLSGGYGTYPITSDNINFNYRKNKINVYGNYSFSINKNDQVFFTSREYINLDDLIYTETTSNRIGRQRNHNLRLGFDYEISNKTVMGILLDGYDNKWSMDAFNESFDTENEIPISYVDLVLDEINYWKHFGANFNIMHKFAPDKTLSFDLNYLQYNNDNPTNYLNTYYDEEYNFSYDEMTRS
jgi:outer membrane receptor for ferrienterochelin and colicin